MTAPLNKPRRKPLFTVGLVSLVVISLVLGAVWFQFRGEFLPRVPVTMLSSRAGLAMDPGAAVTYNGVHIGRVTNVELTIQGGERNAKLTLDVDPKYFDAIPANVNAEIAASTAFGNKYVVWSSPKDPVPQRLSRGDTIDASHVTTEFDTLFETVVAITEKVDPIKLNTTLTAVAQALDGLGDKFGQSIVEGNAILDDLNPRMPQLRYDIARVADLADVYADASPDLWDALEDAVTTARTVNAQQSNLDAALMASVGFGDTAGPVLERSAPFLVRVVEDLIPTAELLDYYHPELRCVLRNSETIGKRVNKAAENGYALSTDIKLLGGQNAWVYPDNLPRVNASGGPEGRPGCWQMTSRELYPAPYLVMDTGASLAPYNHLEIGSPYAIEYVWGRQVGENTINP